MISLVSARLTLRQLDLQDDEFILTLLNEPSFIHFIGDKGVRNLTDARAYITKGPMHSYLRFGFGLYRTSLRDGDLPIGICGLVKRDGLADVDLGFAFLRDHWSKGYAAEAAAVVLAHAKHALLLRRVVAITAPDNHGSIAVLEKVGLTFDSMVRLAAHGAELKLFVVNLDAAT